MREGLALDLMKSFSQEEATQGPAQGSLFNIEGTDWSFYDGDTLKNSQTNQRIRLRGIDTRETAKFLKESGFGESELGGDEATAYLWDLARKHGFNRVVTTGKQGFHGRDLGDLVNEDGHSFVDTLLRTGVVSPSRFSTEDDLESAMWGAAASGMKVDESFLSDGKQPLDPYEEARQAIYSAETAEYGGLPVQKLMAFSAAEFAANPDLYMGIRLRTAGSDWSGKSLTPFGTGLDVGLANLYKGLNTLGQAAADRFGFEGVEASFASDAAANQAFMDMQPSVQMNLLETDWTSFDELTDSFAGLLGSSLPFMGATMIGMAAAPLTYGTSMALPISMYTGMTLDSMEGDIEDKNLGLAIAAGAVMTYLDKLGIKGIVSPATMITKEGRQQAINAIAKKEFSHLGAEAAQAAASKRLLEISKKGVLSYIDDAKAFGANQITKGHLFRESVSRLVKAGGGEGATEALQELTEYTASVIGSEKVWNYDEIEERMANAILAGGLLGASFSVPGTAFEIGDWKSAVDHASTVDDRFNNIHSPIADGYEVEQGFIPTVDDIAQENIKNQAKYDAAVELYNKVHRMDRTSQEEWKKSHGKKHLPDLPDIPMHITARADMHTAPTTTVEHIKAFMANPMVALRGSLANTIYKAEGKSRTLVKVYDMLGATRHKVHGGAGMIQLQTSIMAEYSSMRRDQEVVEASFNVPAGMSSKKRADFVSTLANKFYREVIEPLSAQGKTRSDIDWNSPNISEDIKANKEALLRLHDELTKLADTILNDTNATRRRSKEELVKKLPNWAYRHKGFKREDIARHREEFAQTLMKEYGMPLEVANQLTENIINNEEVQTLGDAFDVTKGGISPSFQKKRALHISDRPAFDKFLEQNIMKNMTDASRESARFQAHRKFIGKDSQHLNRMLEKAEKELMASMEPEAARKLINEVAYDLNNILNAESGNYKRILNQTLKQGQKYLTLLTTLQGLANAAFSSIPEMAMIGYGVPREVLVKNSATQGYLFGSAVGAWLRNLMTTGRVAKPRENLETFLDKKIAEVRSKGDTDPRNMFYQNMKDFLKVSGFKSQETGAATTTGVQETNELTKGIIDSFFKANFLHDQQDMHRMMRLSFFNDFLIEKLDLIDSNWGQPDTVGVKEAKVMLRELGIPLHIMQRLGRKLKAGEELTPKEMAQYKKEFLNGATNFVNQAIPMPNALNRPLFYSDPRFALLTQFNGFTSTFTANQLPLMWDQLRGKGSLGMTYSTFATMGTMLALAFMSQGIKDELKYGEESPYLSDNEKVLRAIYSSGLLGTTERVIGSNYLFPLYENRSSGAGEFLWDNVASEAAATGTVERAYGMAASAIEGDGTKFLKNFYGSIPFIAPYKHRIMEFHE